MDINIWFSDEFYKGVNSLNIEDNMVTVDVDDQSTEIHLVDNANVLIVERDEELDSFCNIDQLIEDIKRLCKVYGHDVEKTLAGIDADGQLEIQLKLNAFEL